MGMLQMFISFIFCIGTFEADSFDFTFITYIVQRVSSMFYWQKNVPPLGFHSWISKLILWGESVL